MAHPMNEVQKQKCVMIIAGEASGDLHGAKLVNAMQKRDNSLFFCGIGGKALREAGVRIFADSTTLAVVGITEVFTKIPSIFHGIGVAKKLLKSLNPDLLILIDFPDFNLHIAATAKKLGIPVLYYICPQVWAWRSGRVKKIKKLVDHVAVILPFEADFFRQYHIPVTFVGHPLLDTPPSAADVNTVNEAEQKTIIGLLPGSRDREIERLLPVMLVSAHNLVLKDKNLKFLISIAPSVDRTFVESIVNRHIPNVDIELVSDGVNRILVRSRLVVATSGTVTLEAAISGVPMIILYKLSPLTYWLARALVKVGHCGLVNLIAGKEIVPELVQNKASPTNITLAVMELLNNQDRLEALKNELLKVKAALGGPGASQRVADIALNML
jgi:lipid-A-disaccharide synthase